MTLCASVLEVRLAAFSPVPSTFEFRVQLDSVLLTANKDNLVDAIILDTKKLLHFVP